MKSVFSDINEINKIMTKAGILSKVQKETCKISSSAKVTDGKHEDVDFDVVVKCASSDFENVQRRLASMPEVVVEKIVNNILGVREKHGK